MLTCPHRESNAAAEYSDKINALRQKISSLIPGSSDKITFYSPSDPGQEKLTWGVVSAQYSPYDHDGGDDGRMPQARIRVFCEGRQEPVIDRSWDSPFVSGNTSCPK